MTAARPHIAYVCADRGVPVGGSKGASLHVAELVRALGERGAEVEVLAARVSEGITTLSGANVTDVGSSRSARRSREVLLRSSQDAPARGAGASEAAAVLFNHDLARALKRLHRKRAIEAVYERYSLWSFAAAAFAKAHGIPYLLEVNAPLPEEQKRYRELENEALASALERWLLMTADRVIVPSAALVRYAVSCGAAKGSVLVLPNGADPVRFRPSRRRQVHAPAHEPAKEEFVIGFVGSLKPWHGLDELARAFRRLHRARKNYRLLIVGDGPLRAELESQLAGWGLRDAVTFTGAAAHEDVPGWIARMDVAVAPYPRDAPTYFSPIKIFEYMAAGVPVVASRVGQIAEFLGHRRTAMLHRPGDIAAMAACIDELRRRPAFAQKLSRAARSHAVRHWTWKRNAERVLALYRRVERELARSSDRGAADTAGGDAPKRSSARGKRVGAARSRRKSPR